MLQQIKLPIASLRIKIGSFIGQSCIKREKKFLAAGARMLSNKKLENKNFVHLISK
jgi:hypothetical protein